MCTDQLAWDQISNESKSKIIHQAFKDNPCIGGNPHTQTPQTTQLHTLDNQPSNVDVNTDIPPTDNTNAEEYDYSTFLINVATRRGTNPNNRPIGDLRDIMSNKSSVPVKETTVSKMKASLCNVHDTVITYLISSHRGFTDDTITLNDCGANGGIVGHNMCIINTSDCRVDISGIIDHQMTKLHIIMAGGVIPTQHGNITGVFHQNAHVPQGRTIHSSFNSNHLGWSLMTVRQSFPQACNR